MLGNMSPGAAITPLLPCLQRSDALKFTNIEEKYKCKNTMQMEDTEKNIHHKTTELLFVGEMGDCRRWRGFALYKEAICSDPGVTGQDLLYYLPTTTTYIFGRQIYLAVWTNTF